VKEYCDFCGMETYQNDSLVLDGSLLCFDCIDANFERCECTEYHHIDDSCEYCSEYESEIK